MKKYWTDWIPIPILTLAFILILLALFLGKVISKGKFDISLLIINCVNLCFVIRSSYLLYRDRRERKIQEVLNKLDRPIIPSYAELGSASYAVFTGTGPLPLTAASIFQNRPVFDPDPIHDQGNATNHRVSQCTNECKEEKEN